MFDSIQFLNKISSLIEIYAYHVSIFILSFSQMTCCKVMSVEQSRILAMVRLKLCVVHYCHLSVMYAHIFVTRKLCDIPQQNGIDSTQPRLLFPGTPRLRCGGDGRVHGHPKTWHSTHPLLSLLASNPSNLFVYLVCTLASHPSDKLVLMVRPPFEAYQNALEFDSLAKLVL